MFTKKAYKKLNSNYQGIRFIRPFEEYTIQDIKDLIEIFDNYILQLNSRIKINKEIIEENFDLNPSLCHDLEVENTALEFALMLIEGDRK